MHGRVWPWGCPIMPYLTLGKQNQGLLIVPDGFLGVSQVEARCTQPLARLPLPLQVPWEAKGCIGPSAAQPRSPAGSITQLESTWHPDAADSPHGGACASPHPSPGRLAGRAGSSPRQPRGSRAGCRHTPGSQSTAPEPSGSPAHLESGTQGSIPSWHIRQSQEPEIPVRPTVQRGRTPVPAQRRAEAAQGVVGSTQVLQQRSLPAPVPLRLPPAEPEGPLKALGSQGEDVELGVAEADVVVEFPWGQRGKAGVGAAPQGPESEGCGAALPRRARSGMVSQSERHRARTLAISAARNCRLCSMEPLALLRATAAASGLSAAA